MSDKKIIIIGAVPHKGISETYGGTTVLMQSFISYCQKISFPFHFIQSNKHIGRLSSLRNLISIFNSIFRVQNSQVIMLNVASRGAFYLGPLIYLYCKLTSKKLVFRKFGGNFHHLFIESTFLTRKIFINTVLKSDLLFFETIELKEYFQKLVTSEKVYWFPNVRSVPKIPKTNLFRGKYVFISHVKRTKGIQEILNAIDTLQNECTIDIYGPIMDDSFRDLKDGNHSNYKGTVEPEHVIDRLSEYDVLLLPTYHPGEGYPGIIIEALSLGIPVITTNWNAIPEIIENKKNGILIPIKDSIELVNAIRHFNHSNYSTYAFNAMNSFTEFHDEKVYSRIINLMLSLK